MKLLLAFLLFVGLLLAGERQVIRDNRGKLVGTIVTTSQRIEARDATGRLLGFYKRSDDFTRDATGRKIAKGNILAALVWRNRK